MHNNATFLGAKLASSDTAKSGRAADEAELNKESAKIKNKQKNDLSSQKFLETQKPLKMVQRWKI
jgi:hypothetical protein